MQNYNATVLLTEQAVKASKIQKFETIVFNYGEIDTVDGHQYDGENMALNEIENVIGEDDAFAISADTFGYVVSTFNEEGEASVKEVYVRKGHEADAIKEIDLPRQTCASNLELPEIFQISEDGYAETMDLLTMEEVVNHQVDENADGENIFSNLVEECLGEAINARFFVVEHANSAGETMKSLMSCSTAPEKTQPTFEFHGIR